MDTSSLVEGARLLLDDTHLPYLWSDEELEGFALHAYQDAIVRTDGQLTSDTVIIPVIAGTAEYALDPLIAHVMRAKLTNMRRALVPDSLPDMDARYPNWQITEGEPTRFIQDLNALKLTLYPIPKEDDTLTITVRVLPNKVAKMPYLPEHLHYGVVYLMAALAYRKNDADAINVDRAMYFNNLSEDYFGQNKSANAQQFERSFVQKQIRPRYFA